MLNHAIREQVAQFSMFNFQVRELRRCWRDTNNGVIKMANGTGLH